MHVSCLELLNLVPRVDGNIGNEVRGGHNQSREEGNRTSRKNRVSVFIDLTPRFLLPPFDMYAICAYVSGHPSNVFLFACDFEGRGGADLGRASDECTALVKYKFVRRSGDHRQIGSGGSARAPASSFALGVSDPSPHSE